MSRSKSDVPTENTSHSEPAIGLIARNDIDVLENVLRAKEFGLTVILADTGGGDVIVEAARHLGALIIQPPVDVENTEELRPHFVTAASREAVSGVLVPEDSSNPIDIPRSIEEFDSDAGIGGTVSQKADGELDVLVAIPAYNEEASIGAVVGEAREYADSVIVVDDGSSDDTAPRAKEAGAEAIEHEENRGYGAALRTAFQEAEERRAEHLVILDGDGQHDPKDIRETLTVQTDTDAEIVIGSRFADGSDTDLPIYRRFGIEIVNILTNLSMGVVRPKSWVRDTQSGFRTYNRRAIQSLSQADSIGEGMSASTDILYHAHKHGYELEEIGTTIDYSVDDPSSQDPVSHGLSLVSNILKTIEHERPILSLGVPGFTSAFVGLGFGYWTFSNFLNTGTFPIGLALTSAVFALGGVFACFTAIILHSLNTHLDT